jgi:hypothetical protein
MVAFSRLLQPALLRCGLTNGFWGFCWNLQPKRLKAENIAGFCNNGAIFFGFRTASWYNQRFRSSQEATRCIRDGLDGRRLVYVDLNTIECLMLESYRVWIDPTAIHFWWSRLRNSVGRKRGEWRGRDSLQVPSSSWFIIWPIISFISDEPNEENSMQCATC